MRGAASARYILRSRRLVDGCGRPLNLVVRWQVEVVNINARNSGAWRGSRLFRLIGSALPSCLVIGFLVSVTIARPDFGSGRLGALWLLGAVVLALLFRGSFRAARERKS